MLAKEDNNWAVLYTEQPHTSELRCVYCCIFFFFTPDNFLTYLLWLIFILPGACNYSMEHNAYLTPVLFSRIILLVTKLSAANFS